MDSSARSQHLASLSHPEGMSEGQAKALASCSPALYHCRCRPIARAQLPASRSRYLRHADSTRLARARLSVTANNGPETSLRDRWSLESQLHFAPACSGLKAWTCPFCSTICLDLLVLGALPEVSRGKLSARFLKLVRSLFSTGVIDKLRNFEL